MKKKVVTILSVLIILVFIGYMIFDSVKPSVSGKNETKMQKSRKYRCMENFK